MTKYDPHKHHRRSLRLEGYDYTQPGYYFVTICIQDRACLLGECTDGLLVLNPAGEMVEAVWQSLPERFPSISLDTFGVMPNHVHFVTQNVGATLVVAQNANDKSDEIKAGGDEIRAGTRPAPTVGDVVGAFKSLTTHRYTVGVKEENWPGFNGRLWQRNYYEHIIRNETALNAIREYIFTNPSVWEQDQLHPNAAPNQFNKKGDKT